MITEPLIGYVLHKYDSGETSARVVFFTREKGIIHAQVKGAKTRKKQAVLQPFIPLWIVLDERAYGAYVREIEIVEFSPALIGEYLFSGLYVNELLYRVLHPAEVELTLFNAYQATVLQLASTCERATLEMTLRRFEMILIESLGAQVSFIFEADGSSLIQALKTYRFVPHEGFILDENGFLGAHILAMAHDEWDDPAVLKTAKRIMRRIIYHVLDGVELKTRQLLS